MFSPFPNTPSSSRARNLNTSIWSPQAQPSDASWSRKIESLNRVQDESEGSDVFGPVHPQNFQYGGYRDESATEIEQDCHVMSLLRSIDLNPPFEKERLLPRIRVPAPFEYNEPDFSPASTASDSLLPTPNSSPLQSFFPKSFDDVPFYETRRAHDVQPITPPRFPIPSSHYPSARHAPYPPAPHVFPSALPILDTHVYEDEHATIYSSPPRRSNGEFAPSASSVVARFQRQQNALAATNGWIAQQSEVSRFSPAREVQFPQPPPRVAPSVQARPQLYSSPTRTHQNHPTAPNFAQLLPASVSVDLGTYHYYVGRIVNEGDQQASIFLQQKLKNCAGNPSEREKIVDALCAQGVQLMLHRFGNWAIQRALEPSPDVSPNEKFKFMDCMRGRIVEIATNGYGCHVIQKALDCDDDIRWLIVLELLNGEPAKTIVNKHASHVWSKTMELTWSAPAPPIFQLIHEKLKGTWASLACHETGCLVVQHAFENLEEEAKQDIVAELLAGPAVFRDVVSSEFGAYCVQHLIEHGSEKHLQMTVELILEGLLAYTSHEFGYKSVDNAIKNGGETTIARFVRRMCEPGQKGPRRAIIVDLALTVNGSTLITDILQLVTEEQGSALYNAIRGHLVTVRGGKTGSKIFHLFTDRMRGTRGQQSHRRR